MPTLKDFMELHATVSVHCLILNPPLNPPTLSAFPLLESQTTLEKWMTESPILIFLTLKMKKKRWLVARMGWAIENLRMTICLWRSWKWRTRSLRRRQTKKKKRRIKTAKVDMGHQMHGKFWAGMVVLTYFNFGGFIRGAGVFCGSNKHTVTHSNAIGSIRSRWITSVRKVMPIGRREFPTLRRVGTMCLQTRPCKIHRIHQCPQSEFPRRDSKLSLIEPKSIFNMTFVHGKL